MAGHTAPNPGNGMACPQIISLLGRRITAIKIKIIDLLRKSVRGHFLTTGKPETHKWLLPREEATGALFLA